MKICHVNLASGYHGGENQTLQLIKQQLKMGYELTVVANPKSPFAKAVKELGCNLVLAPHYLTKHQRTVTQGCHCIHVHEGRAIYWALIQHLLFGTPYIITRRIDNPLKKKWLSNLAYRNASYLVGLSNEIVSKIRKVFPEKSIIRIPSSPVSYSTTPLEIESIKQMFQDKFLVIHAANMLDHKGFDVTINAARELEGAYPDIHFALLGDGKAKNDLLSLANGLSNVSFMGKQSNMGDWFEAASLLVHPSYSEGLGSVILEALGAKLPVIAANAGGIPDIIDDGISGFLIKPGDFHRLSQRIVEVKQDEKVQNLLTDGADKKLELFKIEYTSMQYQDIYQKLS